MIFRNKTVGGVLLTAGTCIGAGMLALPITTGAAGLIPALLLFLTVFVYMLLNLFVLLEANLYETGLEANIISMAKSRLGAFGQIVAWFSFLLLLYAAASAYISGGSSLVSSFIHMLFGINISDVTGVLIFAILFGALILFGTGAIDSFNRILMIGIVVAFFGLALFTMPHVKTTNMLSYHPLYLLATVPVIVLSFTSHIILPSLRTYVGGDLKALVKIIVLGSIIPLLFYVLWEVLIVGVLPQGGQYGLSALRGAAHPVSDLATALDKNLGMAYAAVAVGAFSFFALVTSFLGVILSLADFLRDGFKIKANMSGRVRALLLTLIPPLLFAIYYPTGFILALSYAGVFVAILYGILPPLMVWKARYKQGLNGRFRVFGGKPMLVVIMAFSVVVIILQIAATLKLIP